MMDISVSQSAIELALKGPSANNINPVSTIDWNALDLSKFWLPDKALSLYGVPQFMELPIEYRIRLSHLEYLHIIDAGLWLQGLFIERINRAAARGTNNMSLRKRHLLNILRDEAGHSLMFMEMMHRCGLESVLKHSVRLRILNLLGRYVPFESNIFWSLVLFGEEVPDRLNRIILSNAESICTTIYTITKLHNKDEIRHIYHPGNLVGDALKNASQVKLALIRPILNWTFTTFVKLFYYPPPNIYHIAGLRPGHHWAKLAANNVHRSEFVDNIVSNILMSLHKKGLTVSWF